MELHRSVIACLLSVLVLVLSINAQAGGISVGVSDLNLAVVDSDTGASDFETKLSSADWASTSLSANHLQKLKLSFKLTTPEGDLFSAHQVFLRLNNDAANHLFLFKQTGNGYELELNFLGLLEELRYVSGQYTLEVIVGDQKMDNSFLWKLGTLELDLPEAPESIAKAAKKDALAAFGPKPEITHIFRVPEKRPSPIVSYTFLCFTLMPLFSFLAVLKFGLNVNLGNLPTSGIPVASAATFHLGLASILGLYTLFWIKLNLFTTLQYLGLLGLVTIVGGYGILSHLAAKVKVA